MPKLDRGREIAKPRRRRELRAPRREVLSYTWSALRWLLPARPLDALAVAVALVAVSAVLVNALLLQKTRHPAPLFAERTVELPRDKLQALLERPSIAGSPPPASAPASSASGEITGQTPVPAPRPEVAVVRAKSGLLLDIQRALAARGYYDGVPDGLPGPRTQQAIRAFEQAHGMKPTGEATEGLLARVLRARARGEVTGSLPAAPRPSTEVLAVQRVLSRLGYGPLSYNGLADKATKSAIERFERDRGLARTGKINERLLHELAAVTGAPVE